MSSVTPDVPHYPDRCRPANLDSVRRPGNITDHPAADPAGPRGAGAATRPAGVAVRLRSLRRTYGTVVAVNGLDLDIAPGETVALLGPNGAGKSTTIDMLLGLTRPDSGEVHLFGRTPAEAITEGLVGAMVQTTSLPTDVTVTELLEMVASLHHEPMSAVEAMHRAGISDLGRRRAGRLSGGQQRRVCFAMALLPDPELLVLDEPTAGMDVESRRAFWQAMRKQTRAGKTVLFATHYLAEADDHADRIVLVRSGTVVADGPATEIRAMGGGHTIRATLPGAAPERLRALAGVLSAETHGQAVVLRCSDSDTALRALLAAEPMVRDIEVSGPAMEDAFLALTTDIPTTGEEATS
jgi:ABC-type multidrug transport system, ATPase component